MLRRTRCQCISPHLIDGCETVVQSSSVPLFGKKQMVYGTKFTDGGHLIVEKDEYSSVPKECRPFLRQMLGAREILYGTERWCFWLYGVPKEILNHPYVRGRIEKRKAFLLQSVSESTRDFAERHPELPISPSSAAGHPCLAMPAITSERRSYVPAVFIGADCIGTNKAYLVQNGDMFDFAILSSKMHMIWMNALCGRLRMGYSYSNELCWNTFPVPEGFGKDTVLSLVQDILDARKSLSGMSLAEMYDPDRMPDSIRKAHERLDFAVEKLYCPDGFRTDADRLSCLLRMYAEASEKSSGISQKSVDFFF